MKIKKAIKMSDEAPYLVFVEDLSINKRKTIECFAKSERDAKVKAYDRFGRNIKIIEIRKN